VLIALAATAAFGASAQSPATPLPIKRTFQVSSQSEVLATVTIRCERCAWDVEGREAVVLELSVDDRDPITLPIVLSKRLYTVFLGGVAAGQHALHVDESAALTARDLKGRGAAVIEKIEIQQVSSSSPDALALSLAPIVHARPDTVGRFTDAPLFMWYEVEPTSSGMRYRYSVIFTNEDGGTPVDRLMATWGRATDIEYVYSVEVNGQGEIVSEDMQGPKHEILPFRGRREGRHPLLWVSTDNNMVLDTGSVAVRYAPAPVRVDLTDVSRERVMDSHPWLYEVMARELMREGKIAADAPPGKGVIPDPRRFAYLEGCGILSDNALSFSVLVNGSWIPSDRGLPEYRIVRDGCFRAAVPLPLPFAARDVRAVRVHAHERKDKPSTSPARFTRLNMLFGLNEGYAPGPRLLAWTGLAELRPGGPPLEIAVK
jgi:hypothetical protein